MNIKKLFSYSCGHFFFISDEKNNKGYIVTVEDYKIKFGHTVCCWSNPPYSEMSDAISKNKGNLKEIILCTREGKGYYEKFGADSDITNLSDEEVEKIKSRTLYLFKGEIDDVRLKEQEEKELKKRKLQIAFRTRQAEGLLKELRYRDARDHCEIFRLDYNSLLETFKMA